MGSASTALGSKIAGAASLTNLSGIFKNFDSKSFNNDLAGDLETMRQKLRLETSKQLKQSDEILKLEERLAKSQQDQEEMRKNFYNELQGYKSQYIQRISIENRRYGLPKEDMLQVTLFDSLQGIDSETLKIVNNKIHEVKETS
jgi:Zn-dependent M16 (insulinase) family peptidase